MAPGFPGEEVDERTDHGAAGGGDGDPPVPRERLCDVEGVAGLGGDPLLEDGLDAGRALEEEALDQPDHQAEENGAERSGEPDEDRAAHHEEVSTAFEQASGVGGRRGQSDVPRWGIGRRPRLAPRRGTAGPGAGSW